MALDKPRNKFGRIVLTSLLLAISFFTVISALFIEFYYPAVMPRSPQPEIGRIYPMRFKGQGTVYVKKEELDRSDFVEYRLMPLYGVTALLYFGVATRLGWWTSRPKTPIAKF